LPVPGVFTPCTAPVVVLLPDTPPVEVLLELLLVVELDELDDELDVEVEVEVDVELVDVVVDVEVVVVGSVGGFTDSLAVWCPGRAWPARASQRSFLELLSLSWSVPLTVGSNSIVSLSGHIAAPSVPLVRIY